MDESQKARLSAVVAGRRSANELADLYVSQSAELYKQFGEHGEAASVAFLETLRDALVTVRPFPREEPKPSPVARQCVTVAGFEHDWDGEELSDRFVFVHFGERVSGETDKAVKLGEHWVPKSQMPEVPPGGLVIGEWPVTRWWAEKNDIEYQEG